MAATRKAQMQGKKATTKEALDKVLKEEHARMAKVPIIKHTDKGSVVTTFGEEKQRFAKERDQAKRDRQKYNNETLISLRIDREAMAVFDAILAEAAEKAGKSKAKAPTRSAAARAAISYMLGSLKTKKDRAAWVADILAAA